MIKRWLSADEIAVILDRTARMIRIRAKKENWCCRERKANGGLSKIYHVPSLPEDVQLAYAVSLRLTLESLKENFKPTENYVKKVNIVSYSGRGAVTKEVKPLEASSEAGLKIAALRIKLIESYGQSGLSVKEFIKAYEQGMIAADLRERLGRWGNIHTPSNFYKNWLAVYQKHGIAGLVPQYARRKGGRGASFDEKAKEIIMSLYLDERKPSVASVVRDLVQYGYELNYCTVCRYVNEIPESVKTLHRDGKKAYHDKFDPYLERDYTLFNAMDWGCADHHIFDFVIMYEGRILRPWVTLFIDMRSRKITGWHIDVVPNTLTIMRALSMSVEQYGLFENMLVDNGKDFRSEWFAGNEWKRRHTKPETETLELIEGVLHDCNSNVHFATPYRGQSKPVERFFRTVCEQFSKSNEFYIGSNTVDAPEDKKLYWGKINGREKIEVTYTLEQLKSDFSDYVKWFNSKWHHSGQGMNGKTPDEVFTETVKSKRMMPAEYRKYIFAIREKRVIQRNGVSIDGISYYTPQMVQYIGKKVEVRRDINDIGTVAIFSLPDLVFLFNAESDVFKDTGLVEEDLKRVRKVQKEARKHLKDYRWSEDIRNARKTPAELLAEEAEEKNDTFTFEQALKVVGMENYPVQAKKRKLRSLTDPD